MGEIIKIYQQLFFYLFFTSIILLNSEKASAKHQDESFTKNLQAYSVNEKEILSSKCLYKEKFTTKTLTKWIQEKIKSSYKTDDSFHGMTFKNQFKVLIDAMKVLTTAINHIHADKNKNYQRTFNNEKCETIACHSFKIFNHDEAIRILYLLLKYNINASYVAHGYDYSAPFNSSELDVVISALEDLPSSFFPLPKPKRLMKSSIGRGSVYANASMTVFPMWNTLPLPKRRMAIVHEFGHVFGSHFDSLDEWKKISSWEKDPSGGAMDYNTKATNFVSRYATTNPFEDFAESFTSYLYHPSKLKEISPKKYSFMKKHLFSGIEFFTNQNCEGQINNFSDIINSSKIQFNQINSIDLLNNFEQSVSPCGPETIIYLKDVFSGKKNTQNYPKKCLNKSLLQNNIIRELNKNKPNISRHFKNSPVIQSIEPDFELELLDVYESLLQKILIDGIDNIYSKLFYFDEVLNCINESMFVKFTGFDKYFDGSLVDLRLKNQLNKLFRQTCHLQKNQIFSDGRQILYNQKENKSLIKELFQNNLLDKSIPLEESILIRKAD